MITDPRAIDFCTHQVRPLCERLRGVLAELMSAKNELEANNSQLADLFGSSVEVIDDGLEQDGVSRLTGRDVTDIIAIFNGLLAQYTTVVQRRIARACIRKLRVVQ